MNGDAIVGAIRGVIRGELGSVRTVPASAFGEDVHAGVEDGAKWIRAKVKKRFDVQLSPPERTRDLGPPTANRAVLAIVVIVTLTYAVDHTEDLIDARRYEVRALAAEDALVVTQALSWPGNLAVDGAAAATGLVSAMLRESAPPRTTREDWRAGIYEVELRLRGLVLETQAVA